LENPSQSLRRERSQVVEGGKVRGLLLSFIFFCVYCLLSSPHINNNCSFKHYEHIKEADGRKKEEEATIAEKENYLFYY